MISGFKGIEPKIHKDARVDFSSDVIGNVVIEKYVSVWIQVVIRGDNNEIICKEGSNIQDHVTLHADKGFPVYIGKGVSVGHNAVIHGAHIEDHVLVGMNATVLNGAHIGKNSIIGAGAVVKEGMIVPEGSLVVGNPAVIKKQLSEEQIQGIKDNAQHYITLMKEFWGDL